MTTQNDKKYLCLLDFDETLLFRSKSRHAAIAPNATFNKHIYLRPYAEKMVQMLQNHCQVAVYTSMEMRNASPIVEQFFPGVLLFDRKFNKPDLNSTSPFDTMRDLPTIFNFLLGAYNVHTTVIVDNEFRKVRECALNAIIVPSFTFTKLGLHDDTLLKVGLYLVKLFCEKPACVKQYMQSVPLVLPANPGLLPPPPPIPTYNQNHAVAPMYNYNYNHHVVPSSASPPILIHQNQQHQHHHKQQHQQQQQHQHSRKRSRSATPDDFEPSKKKQRHSKPIALLIRGFPEKFEAFDLRLMFRVALGNAKQDRLIQVDMRGHKAYADFEDKESARLVLEWLDGFRVDAKHRLQVEYE